MCAIMRVISEFYGGIYSLRYPSMAQLQHSAQLEAARRRDQTKRRRLKANSEDFTIATNAIKGAVG